MSCLARLDNAATHELRLIENVHREDLSDAEKGAAVLQLWVCDKYETLKEVCESIQVPYETVKANWLPKARKLSQKIKDLTSGGESALTSFSDFHARVVLKYPHAVQNRLADVSVERKLTSSMPSSWFTAWSLWQCDLLPVRINRYSVVILNKSLRVSLEKQTGVEETLQTLYY